MRTWTGTRGTGHAERLVGVLQKGIIIVPSTARSTGLWLDATRATPLQRVANRPIVCHVLDALHDAGVAEVAIVAPPAVADEITACVEGEDVTGLEVHHMVAHEHRGELGDALFAAAEFVGDSPCIVHRADGLLGQPLLPFVESLREESPDILLLAQQGARDTKRLRLVTHSLLADSEIDLTKAIPDGAGVCLLGPGVLSHALKSEQSTEQLDFAGMAGQIAHDGGSVQIQVVPGWRHFTGDALDLLDMNRMMLDALEPTESMSEDDGNRFEGCVAVHPTACVMSSVIVGPVIVGADALITDSYVGPHTSIGEHVRVEGAEIERSIVLAGASILHVSGRLVASVVGRDARIFRNFSMPRALRLQVGDGDEVALC
jgi:glucose-1-phosphate thymidylyltransferase